MSFLPEGFAASAADAPPVPLPDQVRDGSAPGMRYHISGSLVPVLTLEIEAGRSAYFEHHILLWKSPALEVRRRPLKGMVTRLIAGQDLLVTEAWGPGVIAFSRDGVGQVFPMVLAPGQVVQAREHQFLAATGDVDFSYERVRGVSNMLFGGSGFFIDTFTAGPGGGVVWLHGHGNMFEKRLGPGEQIDVEPGGWVYKDPSVAMETFYQGLSTGLLGGSSLACQRFTGPGRVGIQSGSGMMESAADTKTATPQDAAKTGAWALAGTVLGGLLGSGSSEKRE